MRRCTRRAWLNELIGDGSVDTLVVALTDMQGRLMGKRVQGQAFLGGVIDHGAHFCTYLLGTDMEMNTPDGFALMNWETGYGDWIADPVWDTLRWCPGWRRRPSSCPTRSTTMATRSRLARDDAQARRRRATATWAFGPRPAPSSSTTC